MRSVKSQIVLVIITFIVLICILFGVVGCVLNFSTAMSVLEQNLTETAEISADRVAAEIETIQNVAIETGCTPDLSDSTVSLADKQRYIEDRVRKFGFQRGNLLDIRGVSLFDGNDYSERDYVKAALNGKSFISDPTVSKITGKVTFLVSAPLWKGGVPDSTVVGVIYYAPDENFLNQIVSGITVGQDGSAYLLNKTGTTVASNEPEMVAVQNSIEESAGDSSLKALAEIEKKMIAGELGFGVYRYQGITWVQGYAPVSNTEGWSIGVSANRSGFMGNFFLSLAITVGLAVVFVILGCVVAFRFAEQLSKPIRLSSERLSNLSEGDLHSEVYLSERKDETGVLSHSTASLAENMNGIVSDISRVLGEMADGNLDVHTDHVYKGDFLPVQTATARIIRSLNEAMSRIGQASEQVSSGSEQVACGAQALSQGSTEQASSVQELSATISEIAEHVSRNADNAARANELSSNAGQKLMGGNEKMSQLLTAMEEINGSSKKIGNIIKTIEDIAFQTNILALNAAIEAARAGAAGKGFAVVADEVRSLASKSAEAAESSTALIKGSINAVQNGSRLAAETASAMNEVLDEARESNVLVTHIAQACGEQAEAIVQVRQGMEQISAVVQTNSATAQQSAAASEELSGQAQMLKSLVGRFRLNESAAVLLGDSQFDHF